MLLMAAAIGSVAWVASERAAALAEELERRSAIDEADASLRAVLARALAEAQAELTRVETEVASAAADATEALRLAERLNHAESRLGAIGQAIEATNMSLSDLAEAQARFGRDEIEAELDLREERLQRRYEALSELVSSTRELAEGSLERVARIDEELSSPRDLATMWRELVGPVVQLSGDTSVGSGVLLKSLPTADGTGFDTHLLTAWHVVRDIQGDLSKTDLPVPVTIYSEDGTLRKETAKLLCFDVGLDVALLMLRTPDALPCGAALATRARLEDVHIFDDIYAVGCPLGNDPIPTHGEVATCHHEVDGERYWMINAPTYIGNSGGGIFDGETHALLGIFSKIYTHGSLRPTIVPHMGLVTPLDRVYEWLERENVALAESAGFAQIAAVTK
jgi:hypothetical protein